MLGKDKDFLIAPTRIANFFAKLVEFGILPALGERASELEKLLYTTAFCLELAKGQRKDGAHRSMLDCFVLFKFVLGFFLVGGLFVLDVFETKLFLERLKLLGCEPPGAHVL